jgi:O-antigen/teichoic acid export membrane protein
LGQVSETVVKPGAQLAILILLAALGSSAVDLTAALASLAFATVLATAVALALRRRLRPPELQRAPMRQEDRQRWLRSLLPVSLTGGLLLLSQQLDVIMLGLLASDAQTGVYKVAAQASLIVPIVLQAATPVFAPHTAGLHARMDHARLQRQIGRATGLIFLISLLPTALFVAFGAHILAGVFGPAYATGHLPFAILCLAQLGNVACGFTGLLLEMTGRERDATAGVAGGVLTNLVLNLVLIPPYGMAGAAVATAVGLLVWNMLLVVSIRRRLNINATAFNPTIWRDIFRAPAKP